MSIKPATLSSLASTLIDRRSGTLNGTATLKPYPPLVPVTCNALSRTVPFASPQREVLVSGPAKTGLGKRLILCTLMLLITKIDRLERSAPRAKPAEEPAEVQIPGVDVRLHPQAQYGAVPAVKKPGTPPEARACVSARSTMKSVALQPQAEKLHLSEAV